jgi:DtxR family transcriptional regulator, Mn-dependent transcriptional regulator
MNSLGLAKNSLSEAKQDYLKAIHQLSHQGSVSTTALADILELTPASVTGMLRKLSDLELVQHTPYHEVVLTKRGEHTALEVVRHHRLLETYLHQVLGYALDEVHGEAERLEHHISEDFEKRIAEKLGHPSHDPHGDPIPSPDGTLPPYATLPLAEVGVGSRVTVGRVSERNTALLRYLISHEVLPGSRVQVLEVKNEVGVMRLVVSGQEHVLSLEAARQVWVQDVTCE